MDLFLCHIIIMLGRENDSLKTNRLSCFIIFHGNLCLSIRSEIAQCAVFSHLGQLTRKLVRK